MKTPMVSYEQSIQIWLKSQTTLKASFHYEFGEIMNIDPGIGFSG